MKLKFCYPPQKDHFQIKIKNRAILSTNKKLKNPTFFYGLFIFDFSKKTNTMKKYLPLLFFLLLFLAFTQGQKQIKITKDGKSKYVKTVFVKGMPYLSAKDFAEKTKAGFYANTKTKKAELKIGKYRIVLTAWNQFIVIKKKGSTHKSVIQLPVSVKYFYNDIYFPLNYLLPYLEKTFGKKITFNPKNLLLTFTATKYSEKKTDKETIVKSNSNSSAVIYAIEVERKINGTLIRLKSRKYIRNAVSNILDGKLILLLPRGITVDKSLSRKFKSNKFLREVTVKNVSGNYQIDFTLRKKFVSSDVYNDIDSKDLLITLYNKKMADDIAEIERMKNKWKFDVVVIDAGHGGKDPGALGYYGVKEKDVNLAVALKLGNLIKHNLKNVKVVYTRKTDKFVELKNRGKIANKNHGDLFISIHCNSTRKRPTNASGFEVYLLRPGRTKEAIEIAEIENSVINYESHPEDYKNLLDENYILVSMERSAFMRYSEKFAEILSKQWDKDTHLKSRGVKQAGLYVLVGASMPAVLIETGYVTNPKDAKYLKSKRGQSEMARAIFNAIKEYKKYYDKIFE